VVRSSSSAVRRQQAARTAQGAVAFALPRPGEVIGTFVLEEAIGVGGMGAVYRALDAQLDRHVALKLLPPDQTSDPEIVQRFYQEGRSAARLDHENIARVYSIGQDGPHHYIAFEYIEGITVRRRVDENGPLPVGEAVDIALQIASALVHAAGRGVVHRDIKPSNIILTTRGRAKLVDMGLARRFEREADHGLTQSGMTLGTFDYISPEQARDPRDVDVRSDLYSLGCTIFHMLTGQPPFPGGTVLQKLLQHQEEPPPEVQSLNPAVPVELARIITRLLAKDRDRRYQSAEQLVRDLLVVAGKLGVPVLSPDQHTWISAGHHVTWERHLIWFFPALAFCVVVAGLVWWGRELNTPVPAEPGLGLPRSPRVEAGAKGRTTPPPGQAAAASVAGETDDSSPTVAALPRSISVRPGEDLYSAIATAPAGSILTLTDDGPYLLGGRSGGIRGPQSLLNRDLTIRAESGIRPVLRFAADAKLADPTRSALLPFVGGDVTIEGLTFELDRESPDDIATAISAEDSELTVRGCLFRQIVVRPGRNRAAVRVRDLKTTPATGDRSPRFFADSCHFDGGQIGIVAEGPADILLRDCTLGPGTPAIWIDNSRTGVPVPAEVRLRHSSLMAGPGPVFEIEGAVARVMVDDCVIAPAGNAQPTLVAVDYPRNLIWRGRSNLYSRIHAYMEPTQNVEGAERVDEFSRWKETPSEVREVDTIVASAPVWKSPQPLRDLVIEQGDPTQAFLLDPAFLQSSFFGARQGPYGARLADTVRLAARPAQGSGEDTTREFDPADDTIDKAESKGQQPTEPPNTAPPSAATVQSPDRSSPTPQPPVAQQEATTNLPTMPPMTTSPGPDTEHPDAADPRSDADTAAAPARQRNDVEARAQVKAEPSSGTANQRRETEQDLIRTAEQFSKALDRLGSNGGTLKIASEAELELPATDLAGAGQWRFEAQPGLRRPRIRFRPSVFTSRPPTAWTVLFNLQSGTLHLQGLDLLIPSQDPEAPPTGPEAAIGVSAGTRLELTGCTITIAGHSATSAAVVVQPGAAEAASTAKDHPESPRPAAISITNAFLRSSGDCVAVSSGRLLDLRLRNVLVGTEGSLLHALGSSHIDRATTALKVKIERALARTRGGLIFLESTPDEKELPRTEIEAGLSIFTTAGAAPLFRVDGQGQMELLHDRIIWKAEKVAYDQITTYRRDQILQTGVSPRDYTRSDWRTAFDPKDEWPIVDGVKFQSKLELWRSAGSLTKDDLKQDPRSAAADRGPDLGQIPAAPPAGS
jgi:serine/threonine-protein kinase